MAEPRANHPIGDSGPEVYDPWPLVIVGGPWPGRIGKQAREVAPGTRTHYPWDKPLRGNIVLVIRDDIVEMSPFVGWSCVMSRTDVEDTRKGPPS